MATFEQFPRNKRLHIRVLGPLQVSLGHREINELQRAPILQALLGYLILHRGECVSRSKLAGTFWLEVDEHYARRSLSTQLWRLGRLAEGRLMAELETTREALSWTLPPDGWLDLDEWERLGLGRGQLVDRAPSMTQLEQLSRQVALYRGPFLSGIDGDWCALPRHQYALQYAAALRTLCRAFEEREEWDSALEWAIRWAKAEPYDENAHAALIRLYRQAGQPQAADRAYQNYVASWAELGLPPTPSLSSLTTTHGAPESAPSNPWFSGATVQWLNRLVATEWEPQLQAQVNALRGALSETLVNGTIHIAERHEALFDWEAAQQAYCIALSLLESDSLAPSSPTEFDLRLRLDQLLDRREERPAQRENLRHLLRVADRLGQDEFRSEVWARQCWLEQRMGRLTEALQAASKALSFAGEILRLRAQALRLLGVCHDFLGDFRTAISTYRKALAQESVADSGRRLSHINLVGALLAANQPWEALDHATTALPDGTRFPPTHADILAQGNFATVQVVLGDFQQATLFLQHALAHAKLLGAQSLEAWLLTRNAMLYRWLGRFSEAEFWATEAWRMSQGMEDGRTAIEAALELASLASARGSSQQGYEWCDRAEALATQYRIPRYTTRLELVRAYLAARIGNLSAAEAGAIHTLERIAATGEERLRLPALTLLFMVGGVTSAEWHSQAHAALRATLDRAPNEKSRLRYSELTALRRWAVATAPMPSALSWTW